MLYFQYNHKYSSIVVSVESADTKSDENFVRKVEQELRHM